MDNYKLLSGNEALAQGAYEAGVKFASSYPGTPATDILEYFTQFKEIDAQWAINEKVAFEVALGASFAGVRSIYSSKHVGINVCMDPLMTATYSGINAGFVIVTGDDPGMHSSQNEQDNRLVAKFAKIPLLEPSSPSEAKKLIKLQDFSNNLKENSIEIKDKKLGIVCDSVSYLYVKETYPNASILKLTMTFPFADAKIKEFASKVENIVVVEESEPFIEEHLLSLGIKCKGKHYTYRVGELNPESVRDIVEEKPKVNYPKPTRKPVLCPGCPHRATFVALRKTKVIVAGDIGCYTLGATPPLSALHTSICMGSSVTIMSSLTSILGSNSTVAVIGDSTFCHSGIEGLINCAYNKAKGVIIILDNATTAMTGAQPNPATGITAKGEQTKKLDLEKLCIACGADIVEVIDSSCSSIENKIKELIATNKLCVLIVRYSLCKMIVIRSVRFHTRSILHEHQSWPQK